MMIIRNRSRMMIPRTAARLNCFGSCENGFWMRGSDVDSCLVAAACSTKEAQLSKLKLVQALLHRAQVGGPGLVVLIF